MIFHQRIDFLRKDNLGTFNHALIALKKLILKLKSLDLLSAKAALDATYATKKKIKREIKTLLQIPRKPKL